MRYAVTSIPASEFMEERPLFSVITPSLNHGDYLADCLASVGLQGVDNVEHLVLDGGSTDNTQEVTEAFAHGRFISLPGTNQSEALTEGFRRAKGHIICWLNTDDILLPGAFERARMRMGTHGDRTYLTSHYLFVDKELNLIRKNCLPSFSPFLYRNYAVYLPTSGSFVTNTVYGDGIRLDSDLEILMDRDYALKLHEAGYQCIHEPDYLSAFRLHDNNKSGVGRLQAKKADPRADRRIAERNQISEHYGGVFLGKKRLLSHHPALSRLAWVSLVAQLRFNRLRIRMEDMVGVNDVAPDLARWTYTLKQERARLGC